MVVGKREGRYGLRFAKRKSDCGVLFHSRLQVFNIVRKVYSTPRVAFEAHI